MYATVRTSFVRPDKIDDAVRIYRQWVASAARDEAVAGKQRGLIGVGDRTVGKGIQIALYDSTEDRAAGSTAVEASSARSRATFAIPPLHEDFQVYLRAFPEDTQVDDDGPCARLTIIRARPDAESVARVFSVVEETVLAQIQRQSGHLGYLGLGNPVSGKTMHLAFFSSESSLEASESSGNYQNQLARLADVLAEPPTRELFEVTAMRIAT